MFCVIGAKGLCGEANDGVCRQGAVGDRSAELRETRLILWAGEDFWRTKAARDIVMESGEEFRFAQKWEDWSGYMRAVMKLGSHCMVTSQRNPILERREPSVPGEHVAREVTSWVDYRAVMRGAEGG